MLENLKGKWTEAGLAQSSQQQLYLLISRVYTKMRDFKKYTGYNPYQDVRKISAKKTRQKYLTYTQLELLLSALKKDYTITYRQAALATYCGLRKEEVLRLAPRDIDLERKLLHIKTKHRNKWKMRVQPYPKKLTLIIDEMLAEHTGSPVEPFYPKLSYREFNKVLSKLGWNKGLDPLKDRIHRVCFHTLRHSYASHLLKMGEDIKTVQSMMGHDSLASTMVYLHADETGKRKAAELMNRDKEV
jgi:integrase